MSTSKYTDTYTKCSEHYSEWRLRIRLNNTVWTVSIKIIWLNRYHKVIQIVIVNADHLCRKSNRSSQLGHFSYGSIHLHSWMYLAESNSLWLHHKSMIPSSCACSLTESIVLENNKCHLLHLSHWTKTSAFRHVSHLGNTSMSSPSVSESVMAAHFHRCQYHTYQ